MQFQGSMSIAARSIWDAGVEAVGADRLVAECTQVKDEFLYIGDLCYRIGEIERVAVVGAGKATAAMAAGLEQALGQSFCQQHKVSGWINVPESATRNLEYIHCHPARPAGLNEPTEQGVYGTQKILELASSLGPRDLCITLISGGGSALLPAPRSGISLADKLAVTRLLSSSGANIEQLNTVRKHLSVIKGGGLLNACSAGDLITLVISDVLGDPLDAIASGPTVADSTNAAQALDILHQFDPEEQLPASVYQTLSETEDKRPGQSSVCRSHALIIGNNATAVDAAGVQAEHLGFSHAMQSANRSEGQAEGVGQHLAEMMATMLRNPGPDCLISGGEPVVTLAPANSRGKGGRNQQLALAAMGWLIQHGHLTPQERERISLLAGGTDGEDGPTDAAGAIIDADVWAASERLGLDWRDYLRRNDAYSFFDQCGGLIRTGPTYTNVCDLRVVTVRQES